jgi:tRNA wybutosine-synthesizing protein 1
MPDLIEIKGVTFCGDSKASDLTMEHVPFHEEVRAFAVAIADGLGDEYEVACEHAHSCLMLLAKTKFKKVPESAAAGAAPKWHTWIDYDRFHELTAANRKDPGATFTALDYLAETPDWAVFGASEQGFSPAETRVYRNARYRPSSSGCG